LESLQNVPFSQRCDEVAIIPASIQPLHSNRPLCEMPRKSRPL